VVPKAAGAALGRATLHLHPRNKGAHAIGFAPSADGLECLDVPVVRVEDALRELGVAATDVGLVWMDVEGYEPQALAGLGELLQRAVPIVFEFFPQRYDAATKEQLVKRLAAHYTRMHRLADPLDRALPIAALATIEQVTDVLVHLKCRCRHRQDQALGGRSLPDRRAGRAAIAGDIGAAARAMGQFRPVRGCGSWRRVHPGPTPRRR